MRSLFKIVGLQVLKVVVPIIALFFLIAIQSLFASETAKEKIQMHCGDHVWEIACGRDDRVQAQDTRRCSDNKLTFTTKGGAKNVVSNPPFTNVFYDDKRPVMLEGTTPTAMFCLPRNGKFYVFIEYSRGGGTVGMFFDWFESNGRRISYLGKLLHKNTKSPDDGLNWKQLPKLIYIEGEE